MAPADEIARLEALSLGALAAEVMDKAFDQGGPGAPGKPGTIEAPGISDERVRLNDVARAVTSALVESDDAAEQIHIGNLVAEGLQALELAALVRVTWRGGTEDFAATRRGRSAQAAGEVAVLVEKALG